MSMFNNLNDKCIAVKIIGDRTFVVLSLQDSFAVQVHYFDIDDYSINCSSNYLHGPWMFVGEQMSMKDVCGRLMFWGMI